MQNKTKEDEMKRNEYYSNEELDDKVVWNTIIIPLIASYFNDYAGVIIGIFFMINYLFFIPFFGLDDDIYKYKRSSALFIMLIIYLPIIGIYFIIK